MNEADRTVHARHPDGTEIVRYDRAGKWYIERAGDPRVAVNLRRAVREATRPGMKVDLGAPGGGSFDRLFKYEHLLERAGNDGS